MLNDAGVKAEFYNCVDEDGKVALITKLDPKPIHQSYPNRMHGGVIGAILDESIGRTIQIEHEVWGVTIDLSVKYRKPVPLDTVLYVESRITEIANRYFCGVGTMFYMQDGARVVCATGEAKYFNRTYDQVFTTQKLTPENWFIVKDKEDNNGEFHL